MSFIELNWLSKSNKDILLPKIVFIEMEDSGEFITPQKEERLIGNEYHPADRGILKINPGISDDSIPATIAHEWRHLWQFYRGWEYDGIDWNQTTFLPVYRKQICKYFKASRCEYDALLFELSKYPTDTAKEWYEWIIKVK